jgi:hypothetical protein
VKEIDGLVLPRRYNRSHQTQWTGEHTTYESNEKKGPFADEADTQKIEKTSKK